jgi:hypothetical protein
MEKRIEQEDLPMPNLSNHIKYYTFSITNSMKFFVGQIRRENANFVCHLFNSRAHHTEIWNHLRCRVLVIIFNFVY